MVNSRLEKANEQEYKTGVAVLKAHPIAINVYTTIARLSPIILFTRIKHNRPRVNPEMGMVQQWALEETIRCVKSYRQRNLTRCIQYCVHRVAHG